MKSVLRIAFCVALLPSVLFAAKPAPPPAPFVPAIAYVQEKTSGASDLMLMNAEGTQTKVLVAGTTTLRPHAPSFSPDGTKIVFRYGAALYVVPTAGGTPWKIVALAEDQFRNTPAWSPDGRFILYSDSSGPSTLCGCNDPDLFVVELDANAQPVAGSKARLTATPSRMEYFASWSRDGSRFVASVGIDGNETQLYVFEFDALARSITGWWSLTAGLGKMYLSGRAQWNKSLTTFPNDTVVFSGNYPAGDNDLWYIDTMTRLAGHIIATDSFEGEPSFSPSDGRIVFSNGGWKYDLSIIENAADVIGNQASPIITHTVAVTSGKIVELKECDWNPAVTGN